MATDLFAITVNADDYATTAANDVHDQVTTRTDGGEVEGEVEEENDDDEDDDEEEEKEKEPQSRTFQSEENFQLQRKNYSAKMYGHHHHHPSRRLGLYEEFQLQVFRGFDANIDSEDVEKYADGKEEKEGDVEGKEKIQLSKSQIQFLGQVVGEMYFEEEFEKLVEFCRRVRRRCCYFLGRDGQKGLEERLSRWEGRCLERLGRARGGEEVIG